MEKVIEGTPMYEASQYEKDQSLISNYMQWLQHTRGLHFSDYVSLHEWSVQSLEAFWDSIVDYAEIQMKRKSLSPCLKSKEMPGAQFYPDATINYVNQVFHQRDESSIAVWHQSENRPLNSLTYGDLKMQVGAFASYLKQWGVKEGDRVAAYAPNIAETLVAFLATASLGAIWSSCSPDFGTASVMDRFSQIEPVVLIAVDGYRYQGRDYDRLQMVSSLQEQLPSLKLTILIPYRSETVSVDHFQKNTVSYREAIRRAAALEPLQVPFNHPLWILYTSGTTGLPKPIVQSHGGIVLEHVKSMKLHVDLHPGNRFFWYSTTGWMMWNYLIGGLLVGAEIILYDGSPVHPHPYTLWELAQNTLVTVFGASAAYLATCKKQGLRPSEHYDLSSLRMIGSTGSPLTPDLFVYVYDAVKKDVMVVSTSGGTDVCTAFVTGSVLLPICAGEISCRALGADIHAFNEMGESIINEVGELVITSPMPSMPISFFKDPEFKRYKESYFDQYPGVWRHGDWIKITERGSCVIYGRSDSTINRNGIRMGTSELYQVIEAFDEVVDSLVIDLEMLGRPSFLALFLVLRQGSALTDQLKLQIREKLKRDVSPRHVPDEMYVIHDVPRTLSGKKMEVPIRKILLGMNGTSAANPDSMANPNSLQYFYEFAKRIAIEHTP
ncbi:acetoacetate--CoA ligase [Ferroacidibacillus organovorans]|uniref:Acetoacetyl-CoA synthetase n=1 Tax=Ferroacidibacillus organovorans TaxID=1765683 RepID=A0A853KC59_9BACL|nr:acetoacetate--CoA ligase [Ferroacidibacillus organovorans]KYP80457.1 acetoacetyl-CoA synthetase [Ferroacidibacillus organovorans]OAG94685.1 acetoacetyl-CoA synthetase [Ferroacidibacillus organovorans]